MMKEKEEVLKKRVVCQLILLVTFCVMDILVVEAAARNALKGLMGGVFLMYGGRTMKMNAERQEKEDVIFDLGQWTFKTGLIVVIISVIGLILNLIFCKG